MIRALVMAALLYGPHTPKAERSQKLSDRFEPRPGQLLSVDRISLLENSKNPEMIRGEIWIRPPEGQCLIIRGHFERRDQTICKPTPYKWTINDLDSLGRFRLNVMILAEWDDGTFLTWETPYRIGNFVAAGDKDSGNFEDVLIKRCQATTHDDDRSIVIEAFDGRRWKISLPEFDTPVREVEPEIPNLMVNVDSSKKPGAAETKTEDPADPKKSEAPADKTEENTVKKDEKAPSSVIGSLLSGGYKGHSVQTVRYNLPARGAFKMESGRFSETGAPQGMKGECRYIFENAPGDSKSGAIECHDTDTMDALYVHLPCFSELKVRKKKAIPTKKELTK